MRQEEAARIQAEIQATQAESQRLAEEAARIKAEETSAVNEAARL